MTYQPQAGPDDVSPGDDCAPILKHFILGDALLGFLLWWVR